MYEDPSCRMYDIGTSAGYYAQTDGVTESSSQRGSDGIPGNCKVESLREDRWTIFYKINKDA